MTLFLLLLLSLVSLYRASGGCVDDLGCSLSGTCSASSGLCSCFPPWTGPACAQLAFALGPRESGYGALPPPLQVNAWGGNAVFFEGLWHAYISEMVNNCSLADWWRNSQVVHAVSASPLGPFARAGVALPTFAHEPQVSLSSEVDGTPVFALWHVGQANGDSTPNNCSGAGTPSAAAAAAGTPSAAAAAAAAGSTLHVASSPYGPWSPVTLPLPVCNNPSQARHPNGSIFLLCNNADNQRENNGSLFSAPDIRGPYSPAGSVLGPPPSDANVPEDGFLFFDARGHWHVLYHTYAWPGLGCTNPPDCDPTSISAHSFSRDGVSWFVSEEQPYFNVANFSDSGPLVMSTREASAHPEPRNRTTTPPTHPPSLSHCL